MLLSKIFLMPLIAILGSFMVFKAYHESGAGQSHSSSSSFEDGSHNVSETLKFMENNYSGVYFYERENHNRGWLESIFPTKGDVHITSSVEDIVNSILRQAARDCGKDRYLAYIDIIERYIHRVKRMPDLSVEAKNLISKFFDTVIDFTNMTLHHKLMVMNNDRIVKYGQSLSKIQDLHTFSSNIENLKSNPDEIRKIEAEISHIEKSISGIIKRYSDTKKNADNLEINIKEFTRYYIEVEERVNQGFGEEKINRLRNSERRSDENTNSAEDYFDVFGNHIDFFEKGACRVRENLDIMESSISKVEGALNGAKKNLGLIGTSELFSDE